MDLIYYPGLNCYLASVVNIVNSLGVNYLDAYSSLWSETDFTDERKYNIFTSKKVFENLQKMGIMINTLCCNEIKAEEIFSQIAHGERFVIGMDIFNIPWHPVFNHFHDSHFYFAQKETSNSILCFDPIYNKKNVKMPEKEIHSAFEFTRIYKKETIENAWEENTEPEEKLLNEAQSVLKKHPTTKKKILEWISLCKSEKNNCIIALLKQIIAMINNRNLFRHFLNSVTLSQGQNIFFTDLFFLKWDAVKNGLYRARITRNNEVVLNETSRLFSDMMDEEAEMAKKIIADYFK